MSEQQVLRLEAELLAPPAADFGEGPLWDEARGCWWWTDIVGSTVHRFDVSTGSDTTIPVEHTVGALVLDRAGEVVVAAAHGFGRLQEHGTIELIAAVNADDPTMRMNDGKCDPAGRFYAATMQYAPEDPVGQLLRLDPDHSVHVELEGLTIGNGLAWSADGRLLYYVDTPTGRVDVLDVDPSSGALSNRRVAFTVDPADGQPDGMCIDAEGALWVALWGGGAVRRYSPDGELLALVELPVTNVTCPAFGGPGHDELWITTAAPRHSGSDADEPLGGALFRVRPGVEGGPVWRYAG